MTPLVHPFHRDSPDILPGLEFVNGADNDAQGARNQPAVADGENQQNGQQQASGAEDQQSLGTCEDFRVGLGEDNDADHDPRVLPLVGQFGVKQPQRRPTVGVELDVLWLQNVGGFAHRRFRPFVGDAPGAGNEVHVAEAVDGVNVNSPQGGIVLDQIFQGVVKGGQSAAGGEKLVVGADRIGQPGHGFDLLLVQDSVQRPELDPAPCRHGQDQPEDGQDHQSRAEGHSNPLRCCFGMAHYNRSEMKKHMKKGHEDMVLMPLEKQKRSMDHFAAGAPVAGIGLTAAGFLTGMVTALTTRVAIIFPSRST